MNVKKWIFIVVLALIVCGGLYWFCNNGNNSFAQEEMPFEATNAIEEKSITLKIGNPYAIVDGTQVLIDKTNDKVVPIIQNGRTMLPLRFIGESFGLDVSWDDSSKKATLEKENLSINLAIGENEAYVRTPEYQNHKSIPLDCPATIIEERTFLPVRFISEEMGLYIKWDNISKQVTISTSPIENVAIFMPPEGAFDPAGRIRLTLTEEILDTDNWDWSRFMPYQDMTKEEQTNVTAYLQYAVFPMMMLYDMDVKSFNWDDDLDNDSLNNLLEYIYDTNPFKSDTDDDGLPDYDEIYSYGTNPCAYDTDVDGLGDGSEIKYGMNPINPDSLGDGVLDGDRSFTATVTEKSINGKVIVTLDIKLQGKHIKNLSINKIPESDYFMNSGIPGYIDNAFDFSVEGSFQSPATLTFEFAPGFVSELNEPGFVPAIYSWNLEKQFMEKLPGQTISGNKISASITNFSFNYILVDSAVWDKIWEVDIRLPVR